MTVYRCTDCGLRGNAINRFPPCKCYVEYDEVDLAGRLVRRHPTIVGYRAVGAMPGAIPQDIHVVNQHGTVMARTVNYGLPGCDCGRCGVVPNGMFICCAGAMMAYSNADLAADGSARE